MKSVLSSILKVYAKFQLDRSTRSTQKVDYEIPPEQTNKCTRKQFNKNAVKMILLNFTSFLD